MKPYNLKNRFEEVYKAQSDAVFRFIFFRISNREVAVDLVQDVFMRYWDSLSKGKENGEHIKNDRAFLFTITRNLVIDYYRKKKSVSLDAILDETEDSTFFLEEKNIGLNTESSAEARMVLGKLEELEPHHRQIIYLRFIEGFKPKEIAEILDVSSNVVSVRIVRALEKLKEVTGFNEEE